jgi:hypothetical protein
VTGAFGFGRGHHGRGGGVGGVGIAQRGGGGAEGFFRREATLGHFGLEAGLRLAEFLGERGDRAATKAGQPHAKL